MAVRRTQHADEPKPGARSAAAQGKATKPPLPPVDEPGELQPVALGRATDEDLMRRTQMGDRQAYSLLYERYNASVLSYLYRMLGNAEDVESIGQEVFLRAFRFAPTYKYPAKLSTWLFTSRVTWPSTTPAAASAARCAT